MLRRRPLPNLSSSVSSFSTTDAIPRGLPRTIAELINGQPIPWPVSLIPSLSSLSPHLSRPAVLRSLDLIKPPAAALLFFRWAQQHLPLADDRAHFKMLQVLCHSQDLSAARDFLVSLHTDPPHDTLVVLHDRFFNALIRAYARRGQLREAVELFRQMGREFGVPPSVFSLNSLLAALLRRGRTNSAVKLFDETTQQGENGRGGRGGVSPDVCTFNTLIRGFCLNGMVEEGFRFFRDMARWRCEPDVLTYNTLLDGLCRTGKVRTAHNLLDGMKNKGPDLLPTVVSYTTVIRGYCSKGCVTKALEVLRQMELDGVKPNKVTVNTLVHGLCEAGEMEQIKEIMELQGMDGFKPDTCTFNTLITCHCNMGRVENGMEMFARMRELKLKPDSATYSVLIRALCQTGDFRRAEELLDTLLEHDVLIKRGGCTHLMAAYNPILEYLCQNGKAKKAGILFKQLLKRGTVSVDSLKTMIMGHCKEGELHDAYELLVTMMRGDFVPDEETCQLLVEGFLRKGKVEFAWKAFEKLLNSGHRPKTATFHSVLAELLKEDRCARQAADLILVMLERKIRQNIDLSTGVLLALYKNGFSERGFEVVRILYDHGYKLRMEKLVGFLCDEQKLLEALELLLFSVEKHQNLRGEVYGACIAGLCRTGRASEAFRLFYELNEKGKSNAVASCFEELEIALEKEGKSRESEFVRKRRTTATIVDN